MILGIGLLLCSACSGTTSAQASAKVAEQLSAEWALRPLVLVDLRADLVLFDPVAAVLTSALVPATRYSALMAAYLIAATDSKVRAAAVSGPLGDSSLHLRALELDEGVRAALKRTEPIDKAFVQRELVISQLRLAFAQAQLALTRAQVANPRTSGPGAVLGIDGALAAAILKAEFEINTLMTPLLARALVDRAVADCESRGSDVQNAYGQLALATLSTITDETRIALRSSVAALDGTMSPAFQAKRESNLKLLRQAVNDVPKATPLLPACNAADSTA